MFCWEGSLVFFYLLNIPTVNNLTVCHPRRRRPILSAQMGALLKDFTPTISARCLFVRHFLGLKVCPNYRPSSSLWHAVLLRRQPICGVGSNSGLCTDALQGEEKKKKSGHAFSSITMQDKHNRLLTYGCTVRRCDLQAEYKSQVEQPHRHLLSNALWHRC